MEVARQIHIRRMAALAQSYLADSELLATSVNRSSDGAYLLELLAFEILLKAVRLVYRVDQERTHSYSLLFADLPAAVQEHLLGVARERMGGAADYSNPSALLKTYQDNFVKLRYSYEAYEGLTANQLRALEDDWLKKGASTADATFKYYPKALLGLIDALNREIDAQLNAVASSPDETT